MAAVVTTTSITLSSNKIQNGDVLVPAYSGPTGKYTQSDFLSWPDVIKGD